MSGGDPMGTAVLSDARDRSRSWLRRVVLALFLGVAGWALLALMGSPAQASTATPAAVRASISSPQEAAPAASPSRLPHAHGHVPGSRRTPQGAAGPGAPDRSASVDARGGRSHAQAAPGGVAGRTVADPAVASHRATVADRWASGAEGPAVVPGTRHDGSIESSVTGQDAVPFRTAELRSAAAGGLPHSAAPAPLPYRPSLPLPPPPAGCPLSAGTAHGGGATGGPASVLPFGCADLILGLPENVGDARPDCVAAPTDDPGSSPD